MKHIALPVHPTMRHPHTGLALQAVGFRRSGAPIWPILGASPDDSGSGDSGGAGGDGGGSGSGGSGGSEGSGADHGGGNDETLGEGGKKALLAERNARKALEGEMADLKKNLAAAFGIKDEGDKDGDVLATVQIVQTQLADLQHENKVLALANQHKITDNDDLDLLRGTRDADALAKLAERLAPGDSADDGKQVKGPKKTGTPKPDGSQGGGDAPDAKSSVAAGREMFAARRGKKSA